MLQTRGNNFHFSVNTTIHRQREQLTHTHTVHQSSHVPRRKNIHTSCHSRYTHRHTPSVMDGKRGCESQIRETERDKKKGELGVWLFLVSFCQKLDRIAARYIESHGLATVSVKPTEEKYCQFHFDLNSCQKGYSLPVFSLNLPKIPLIAQADQKSHSLLKLWL